MLRRRKSLRRSSKRSAKKRKAFNINNKKTIKDKAWNAFSLYIRLKNAVNGYVTCVTCGAVKPYKLIHAGHLVPGRTNSILFDERGVYPQCYRCNVLKNGNTFAYINYLKKLHGTTKGQEIIDELYLLSKRTVEMTRDDYQIIFERYTQKAESLLNNSGNYDTKTIQVD